ncbi:MAG: DUF975 family protein [Treponema sp.]|nr:DUF975 family protein [Treponema sp.]
MFERKKYKKFALTQLSGRWTVVVLVTLCIFTLSTIFSLPDTLNLINSGYFTALLSGDMEQIQAAADAYVGSSSNLVEIIQLVVSAILEVASLNVYLKMSRSPEPVSFSAFLEGLNNWARATLAILWTFLWIFIWSFLLIIPGIIKSFAYSQIFYIIAEYKEISVTKALKISMIITKGHKWDLFVMHLTFIGWDLLCIITLGLALLWVQPYRTMTCTNAYHAMLKEAIEQGKIRPEDLAE